jgi:hypothetical protein
MSICFLRWNSRRKAFGPFKERLLLHYSCLVVVFINILLLMMGYATSDLYDASHLLKV